MLTITNMKWTHRAFSRQQELTTLLANRFSKLKLATNLKIVGSDLIFNDVEAGKTFESSVHNKRPMKANDPRIKEKGRDYLQTKYPTRKQYEGFYNIIQSTLDELGLSADVLFYDGKYNKKDPIVLRAGKDKFDRVPVQKNYPVEI